MSAKNQQLEAGYLLSLRAKGGWLWHLVPDTGSAKINDQGHGIALCGYSPLGHSSNLMRNRAGWWVVSAANTNLRQIPWCKACQAARADFDRAQP